MYLIFTSRRNQKIKLILYIFWDFYLACLSKLRRTLTCQRQIPTYVKSARRRSFTNLATIRIIYIPSSTEHVLCKSIIRASQLTY